MSNILNTLIKQQTLKYGDREAMRTYADGDFKPISWNQLDAHIDKVARALEILDVKPGDMIAIFSANSVKMIETDFAAYANRAVPVSIYSTSSPQQVKYIVNDARACIVFCDTRERYQLVMDILDDCPHIRHVVVYNDDVDVNDDRRVMTYDALMRLGAAAGVACCVEVDRRREDARREDLATLIYTSGTTGEPKGAMLTHGNFSAAIDIHRQLLSTLSDNDTSLCFLPLCHIFEKAWTYFCLSMGIRVTINPDPHEIQSVIRQDKPSCMCSVPRFWEKVYTAVTEKIITSSPIKRLMARRAIAVGRRYHLDYERRGIKAPAWLKARFNFYEKHVLAPIRRAIGVEHGNIFPTAGAPLSANIVEFMHALGINIVIGYGLSETTATVTCFPQFNYQIGSVGVPIPHVQVKIGRQDEIMVKGPTVMTGYFNKPKETKEAFTDDGWFLTGDAGYFDASGALVLTERLKDLFKTSNGKYIAPQAIESRLGEDRYIEQVAVIGDRRKYVTAIIIPAFEALKEYAHRHSIKFKNIDDLIHNSEIIKMLTARIEKLQRGLAGFERIKKFTLMPHEFTIERGELTNTLKLRRPVINSHYANQIEAMYA